MNLFDGDVHSGEQFSFPTNLASCCSEHMDVQATVDVIMNVVFWNMIVSVVVVSLCGQGFSMMVVLPWWELTERSVPRSTGMRYRSVTLFH